MKGSIFAEMNKRGLKIYLVQKEDFGRKIDKHFGVVTKYDIGKRLIMINGLLHMSFEDIQKRKAQVE